jgi:antitoxin (DNA-binding transcriptional repressor) of toxin-antitoxin stability system
MSSTIPLEEAQAHLSDLVAKLAPGEEILITQNDLAVARLIGGQTTLRQPRKPGSAIGKLTINSEDDEHLVDFQDYIQ